MPKKPPESPATARVNAIVSLDTAARIDEARAALKRHGVFVSQGALVEVAILELLGRRDLADVLRKHGATARRDRD
jgi:hypothetical protein